MKAHYGTRLFFATCEGMWRFFLSAVLVIGTASTAGCISVPDELPSAISAKGGAATRIRSVFGWHIVETASFTPGRRVARPREHATSCDSGISSATVLWGDESIASHAAQLCTAATQAIDYLIPFAGVGAAEIHFVVTLVPEGHSARVRSTSTNFVGRLRPHYVKPVFRSMSMTTAGLQSTVAHELIHIAAALRGQAQVDVANEEIAYLAGYCATFEALGYLEDITLVQAEFQGDTAATESARRSNRYGASVSNMIRAITGGTRVEKDSPAGDRLGKLCNDSLVSFFSNGL